MDAVQKFNCYVKPSADKRSSTSYATKNQYTHQAIKHSSLYSTPLIILPGRGLCSASQNDESEDRPLRGELRSLARIPGKLVVLAPVGAGRHTMPVGGAVRVGRLGSLVARLGSPLGEQLTYAQTAGRAISPTQLDQLA